MNHLRLQGIWVALVTPFTAAGGLDLQGLRILIEELLSSGIAGLLALGGTGENLALTPRERQAVLETAVDAAQGRVPVVGGILDPGLGTALGTIRMAIHARVDGILVVAPYYATPDQDGIVEYFARISDESPVPLVLYNIPYRTGVNILPSTVRRIVDTVKHVVGIKECTRDIDQVMELIAMVGDRIAVMCGEEQLTALELAHGARGAILATANLAPRTWSLMYSLVRNGDIRAAEQVSAQIRPLVEAAASLPNPIWIKAALARVLGISSYVRPPLGPPAEEVVAQVNRQLEELSPLVDLRRFGGKNPREVLT